MERLHSSEEDLFNLPQDDLAEAFGTPPTRNNSIKPLRKLSGKKSKKLEREGSQAQKDKQELMLNRRQNAKSQARKEARAFKELDTTLQVLGINGKQVAAEPTGEATRKIQRAASEASSEASEVSTRVIAAPPSKPHRAQSSQALNGQVKAVPPRILSSPVLQDFASPPVPFPSVLRDRSGEYSGHSDLSELLSARQEWHAVLDDVLEGTHEDLEAIMISASSKAQDLREQLIMWQTPPEGTWQARRQRLDWLELAMSDAKEMFLGLRRHWNLLEHQNRVTEAVDIMKDVTQELSGMATLCCDAVAEGLRTVQATSPNDIREGFNMQRNILHMVLKLHHRITTGLVTTNGPAQGQTLGPPALEVVTAGFDATMRLQEAVLCPDCLTCGLGGQSAHETNVRARQLQSCWEECQHATHAITSTWQHLRNEAHREWCQVYLKAAQLAEGMQAAATPDQPNARSTSPDSEMGVSHGGGVWGRSPVSECCQVPSVSDEDLQAQAWFPGTLTVMLHLAEQAATRTLNDSSLVEFEGEEYMVEPDSDVEELIDSMSTAFYSLAATGTVRVGRLCKAPQLLACWALELLEEQACHALMFVRDLDTSLLGQNEHGLEQFDTLRKCTDELVNAILHVRQLLKRRRFEAPDVPKPAGLRAARPGPSAKPSIQARPSTQSTSSSNGTRPTNKSSPSSNGASGPSRPPPAPSAKAAAALYRQQPPALTSRSSQLTASLKGNAVGKLTGRPPTGAAASGQASRVSAAAAERQTDGATQQSESSQEASAPVSAAHSQRGLQPPGVSQADQQAQPSSSQDDSDPAAAGTMPVRASYASKVAVHANPGVDAQSAAAAHSHHKSRHKHHNNKGRGRGYGMHQPSMEAAAAAVPGASADSQSSQGAQQSAAPQKTAQQRSPFASQKSWSFGRQAEAATAAAASSASSEQATSQDTAQQCAQMQNGNEVMSSGTQANTSSQQQQQQHPPFRDTQASGSHVDCSDDESESPGGANSSLGTENRDPEMSQEEARAASAQKAAAAYKDLLASPFKAINLDTLPSFTKPLSPSKTKDFPAFASSRLSNHQSAASPLDGAQPPSKVQLAGKPDQAKPVSSNAKAATAVRAEGTERATAPPDATDTTRSGAAPTAGNPVGNSPPASSGLIRQQQPTGPSEQGQLPWEKAHPPTSPNAPLALPESSGLSFKQSEQSGPLQSSSCSDSGFSLLWDDDPFWQGGMMEEWHQKLHNNTSPDDVVICEALIAYLEHDLDISSYWSTLQAANITKERLASFDRPIRSEPSFKPEQKEGLLRDLTNYLQTLKAVHSGADLQSAAAAVLGYDQVSMKGKAIKVEPVPGVATTHLKTLLDAALPKADEKAEARSPSQAVQLPGVAQTLTEVKILMAVRQTLLPALARGNKGCGGRLRDVLYLDLALDGAVRSAIESSLGAMKLEAGSEDQEEQTGLVVDLVTLCTENVCLSVGSNLELSMIHKDYQASKALDPPLKWLRAQAASDRLGRELGSMSERYSAALQPTASVLGQALALSQESTEIFAEEVVRGSSAAPLAQLAAVLAPKLREVAGLDSWQIISPGSGAIVGSLICVDSLSQVQHDTYEQATVLYVKHIGGEEDIPQGVVAVITEDAPDVLCHAAVRARNSTVMLAACCDEEELAAIGRWQGQQVCLELAQGNTTVKASLAQDTFQSPDSAFPSAAASDSAPSSSTASSSLPQIVQRHWCGKFAIGSHSFNPDLVGAKSLNTHKLKGQLPAWVKLPCSAALPFGSFEAALQHPQNNPAAAAVHEMTNHADPSDGHLADLRSVIQGMQAPAEIQEQLRAAFQESGIEWDGSTPGWDDMWRAIKAVWASKWNSRAVSSLRKASLQHQDLQMAVLCQPVVSAQYAFVAHTTNPVTGNQNEIYIELVQGFGEALAGNFPGSALRSVVDKEPLQTLAHSLSDSQSLEAAVRSLPDEVARVSAYPSKSVKLVLPDQATVVKSGVSSAIIFRSDSNGEDLEGYAGAGLFDSTQSIEPQQVIADYSIDRLLEVKAYQHSMLAAVGLVSLRIEQLLGSAQDIEGVIDCNNVLHIVQTRPQV